MILWFVLAGPNQHPLRSWKWLEFLLRSARKGIQPDFPSTPRFKSSETPKLLVWIGDLNRPAKHRPPNRTATATGAPAQALCLTAGTRSFRAHRRSEAKRAMAPNNDMTCDCLDVRLPETDWWKQTGQLASAALTGGIQGFNVYLAQEITSKLANITSPPTSPSKLPKP